MNDELERLFRERPRSEEELEARLAACPAREARTELVARLAARGAAPREVPIYVRAFAFLGASSEDLPSLSDLVSRPTAPIESRAVALALVRSIDPARAQRLAQSVTQAELIAMNDAQLVVVLAGIPAAPSRLPEISEKIARQPPASRALRLAQLERIRVRLGVPAALLYADVLKRDDLGLGNAVVDLLVEEGGAAAAWLCETLWHAAPSKAPRDRWADTLARLYRSTGRAPAKGLIAEAFASEPDASGTRAALVSITSPVDGSLSLAWLRTGTGGTLVSGGIKTLADERDLEDALVLDDILMSRTKLPPASVAAWAEPAIRTTKTPTTAAPELFAAACHFSMAKHL